MPQSLESARETYLRLLKTYNVRLIELAAEIGFPEAEVRTTGLREECIAARTALHELDAQNRMERLKSSAVA